MRIVRLLSVTFAAAVIVAALAALQPRLCFASGESYTFFCGDTSKNCREVTVYSNPAIARLTLKDVCGESTFYADFDLDGYLEEVGGEIVFTEVLSDSVNYYCKANLPYSVCLYGEEINLHVCIKENGVKVASPIIFGGY